MSTVKAEILEYIVDRPGIEYNDLVYNMVDSLRTEIEETVLELEADGVIMIDVDGLRFASAAAEVAS